ncbi:hypothetical protein ABPG77_003941 [Micractinium sp. CCAP 211/92]
MTGIGQKVKEKLGLGSDKAEREQYSSEAAAAGTTTTTTPGAYGEDTVAAQYFTKTEDRPVIKERVEHLMEHRPVEKEYVVEAHSTGVEREAGVGEVEHLGSREQIVGTTPPSGQYQSGQYQ